MYIRKWLNVLNAQVSQMETDKIENLSSFTSGSKVKQYFDACYFVACISIQAV